MRFVGSTGLLENVCFSGVKRGKVSLPRRNLGQRQPGNLLGSVKAFSRFGETVGGFRFHRSRPSSRTSCMKAARAIGPGIKGFGGDHRAGIEQNGRGERCQLVQFFGEGARVFDEHGNIVVGIRAVIAARAGAEQYNALQRSPYASASAARKRVRIGLFCGRSVMPAIVAQPLRVAQIRARLST